MLLKKNERTCLKLLRRIHKLRGNRADFDFLTRHDFWLRNRLVRLQLRLLQVKGVKQFPENKKNALPKSELMCFATLDPVPTLCSCQRFRLPATSKKFADFADDSAGQCAAGLDSPAQFASEGKKTCTISEMLLG